MGSCRYPIPSSPAPGELACFGFTTSGSNLTTTWQLNDCPSILAGVLNKLPDSTIGYNYTNLPRAQDDVQQLFCQYLSTNILTDSTTDPQYNPFQNTLLSLCNDPRLPGVCDKALSSRVCTGVTRSQATTGRVYADFCGCYVPPDPNYVSATGNTACDPLCHRVSTVQRSNPLTGQLTTCSNNICVIDNVSITVNQSDVANGVNFDQVCGGCNEPNHPCECIISGVDVTTTMSTVGLGSQYSQLCGPNSQCLQINDDNTVTQIDCAAANPNNATISSGSSSHIWYYFIGVIAFICLLFLLAFFAYWQSKKERDKIQPYNTVAVYK